MKTVTHTLWPVSYINDKGEQRDTLYRFEPSESIHKWVGDPIEITVEHPETLGDNARLAKIAELEADLAKLRAAGEVA